MQNYTESLRIIKQAHQPMFMGIVNVTPDSFSDGGKHNTTELAIAHAIQLIIDGARIVDIGGESTRPGAKPVDLATELRRVLPVIEGVAKYLNKKHTKQNIEALISIDTTKPEVAALALRYGADIVNDVSGLRASLMRDVIAREQCLAIVMHAPNFREHINEIHSKTHRYKNVTSDVLQWFEQRIEECGESGIKKSQLILDPGIGFGKTTTQNLELLDNLAEFKKLRLPILVGASRKRFIGELSGEPDAAKRLPGTLAAHAIAVNNGSGILRVHDVLEHAQFFDTLNA